MAELTTPFQEFEQFGRGIITPFVRDNKGDFANSAGVELVRSAVSQILGTFADTRNSQGELPWRPDFGGQLLPLKHRPNTPTLGEVARIRAIEALGKWDRRIRVTGVTTEHVDTKLTLLVRFDLLNVSTGEVIAPDLQVTITV